MFDQKTGWLVAHLPGEVDDYLYELTLAAAADPEPAEACQPILECLDEMTPGPFLAAILSSVDPTRLTGADAVTVMRAFHRMGSYCQAGEYETMFEVAHAADPDTLDRYRAVNDYAPEEIGAALSYTRRRADSELGVALDITIRLPRVRAGLASGDIDGPKARVLTMDTAHLEPANAREVVDRIIDEVSDLTTGHLRARLRRLCIEADPEDAKSRYELSVSERKVVAEENPEGTAALIISQCSPEDVYAARDHINTLARRLKTEDEPRTIDQLRADVALDLLVGRFHNGPEGSGGSVVVHADLTTLARLDDTPGELGGYGPVIAEVARKVAANQAQGAWTAVVTDPETGEPLHTVSIRRRPTVAQTRMIRALHPTCGFPGCRMPAINCDLDHRIDHARGGPTTVTNHAPLCRRHHMAKHHGGWRYRKTSRTGIKWVSPLGHTYRTGRPP
jgi:hypothetical protein